METFRRSLLKALSWRVFATIVTFGVAYAITGKTTFALEIGGLDTVIKIAVYFGHERAWARIKYGLVVPPDYQI